MTIKIKCWIRTGVIDVGVFLMIFLKFQTGANAILINSLQRHTYFYDLSSYSENWNDPSADPAAYMYFSDGALVAIRHDIGGPDYLVWDWELWIDYHKHNPNAIPEYFDYEISCSGGCPRGATRR